MMEYSELIAESNRLIREIHKATLVKNFEVAEQYSEHFVRLAHSLQHSLIIINAEERE
jgi:hypothetical protein